MIFCFSWRLESSSYVVQNSCCREGGRARDIGVLVVFGIESLVDYKDFEVFESACVAELMKRRREGSCEYSRRNNEARRCGKMTESPVTFVSSSASEASSGSDDILCPPPGWKPEKISEFEASSGPDGILCPPPSSS